MSNQRFAESGGEHGSRYHIWNFWGLIVAAIITAAISAAALLWVNSRQERFKEQNADLERQIRDHFDQQKTELERQIRALQQDKANQTPGAVERENKRLQTQIDASRIEMEASRKRAAEFESELQILKEELKEAKRRAELAAAPEASPASKSSPAKLSETQPPGQKLERFIVEVPRAHSRGESATVYVRFTSTTNARVKVLLADGFLGQDKTFLVDDRGQHYSLDNSSGIGKCCFGFAGGDWQGAILDLEPKGSGDITLTFRRRNRAGEVERQPQSFTLSAELTVGDVVKLQDWHSPQWQSSGSAGISVPGIVPQ